MGKKCIIPVVFLLMALCFSASALEKPVEGYVYNGSEPLRDATIKVLMKFRDNGEETACMSFPTIFTDERGYFITNLGNLRVLGNNYPCEDRWKKGDVLAVIGKGLFTTLPDGGSPVIGSESGATLSMSRLVLTDEKFEPLYSELSLAKLKITSLEHFINWDSKTVVFNSEVYNPNNVPLEEVFLKIVVTRKDDRNDIVGINEEQFGIKAFETKKVQIIWDTSEVKYDDYLYNAVLYTSTLTHDRILDKELDLKGIFRFLTVQNFLILAMAIIILLLVILLLKSKGIRRREIKKSKKR